MSRTISFYVVIRVGNGYITTATLREILHELDDKLTPDDLDGIIAEIDEDGSGTIDFDGKSRGRSFTWHNQDTLIDCCIDWFLEFMEMMTGE